MSTYETVEEFTHGTSSYNSRFHQPPLQEKLSPNLNEELEKGVSGYISYRDVLYKLTAIFLLIYLQMPLLIMSTTSEISRSFCR